MGGGASVPEKAQAHWDRLTDEQKAKWSTYYDQLKAEGYGDDEAAHRVFELVKAEENNVEISNTADAELVAEAANEDKNWFSTAKTGDEFPEVFDANEAIETLAEAETVKHAAITELHRIYRESNLHHMQLHDHNVCLQNWKVKKYAIEPVPHGLNYFMKVKIMDNRNIHIRVHRQVHHDIYDFHSLHKTYQKEDNLETYIWGDDETLVYFEM